MSEIGFYFISNGRSVCAWIYDRMLDMKLFYATVAILTCASCDASAASIVNLDSVAHQVKIDDELVITLQPNAHWERNQADLSVRLLNGAQPDHVYHLQDRDAWAIWPKGEFGMQMRRSSASNRM